MNQQTSDVVRDWLHQQIPRAHAEVVGAHLDELGLWDYGADGSDAISRSAQVFHIVTDYFSDYPNSLLVPTVVIALKNQDTVTPIGPGDDVAESFAALVDLHTPPELYLYPTRFKACVENVEEYRWAISRVVLGRDIGQGNVIYGRLWRFDPFQNLHEPYTGAIYMEMGTAA